ncbi:unnamed protein product, partial [Lampetra planeri]
GLDNPKICALYIIRGQLEDVPQLPPHPGLRPPSKPNEEEDIEEEEEEDEDEEEGGEEGGEEEERREEEERLKSGPRVPDPYAADNSSLMFPILVAFGVFIPTLFCLCRL